MISAVDDDVLFDCFVSRFEELLKALILSCIVLYYGANAPLILDYYSSFITSSIYKWYILLKVELRGGR